MDPIFPERSCNMDASLDSSGTEVEMMSSANDFNLFLPSVTQGLTESDIAKNIRCNVMMNEAGDDKSTIFSLTHENSPEKKDTFGIDDPSLLMSNDNSLDAFEASKLNVMIAGKESIPVSEMLNRSGDPLVMLDPYGNGYPGSDAPSTLGMELLDDPTSGRGTPVLFRKFDLNERDYKETIRIQIDEKSKFIRPISNKIPLNQDDIMDHLSDMPETRCVKPSDVQSQPVVIEPKMIKSEPGKVRQRKVSGSKKSVAAIKPKIAIQDQSVAAPIASTPTMTSSFVININKSTAMIAPQIVQKLAVPRLPIQNLTPVQSQQLSRLRLKHPIITGILGIPTKGPIWQIPNLFGPGLMHNEALGIGTSIKKELPRIVLESKNIDVKETVTSASGIIAKEPVAGIASESKTPIAVPISPVVTLQTSAVTVVPKSVSLETTGQEFKSKSHIQGILVTDETTFISDRSHSLDNQHGPTNKKPKETVAQLAIKKLLTAKTTELYKGSNLQLTLPITPESEGDDQSIGTAAMKLNNVKPKSVKSTGDSSKGSAKSPEINKTLVDNYMQNWKPTGKYSCTQCPYSSVTRNYLFRHWVMRHSAIKPYQCPYCEVDMGYKDGIIKHQASNHRGKPKNVVIDYLLENKLLEEFSEIFGESVMDPLDKIAIRDRTNMDIDFTIAELSDDSCISPVTTTYRCHSPVMAASTSSKTKTPATSVNQKVSPKGISQASLASIALPIMPAMVNRDAIAISAAVALQSAVLSLTQAAAGNSKSGTQTTETVRSNKQPIFSTQTNKVEASSRIIVIEDDSKLDKTDHAREKVKGPEKGLKRAVSISACEPVMFKIARVESMSEAGKVTECSVSDGQVTVKKEGSHSAVKS